VRLASLYAIGVVGAITLNLASCATNFALPLKRWERNLLFISAGILLLIELTIALQKHNALFFVLTVLATGLALRYMAKLIVPIPIPAEILAINVLTVSEAKELAPLYKSSALVALKKLNLYLLEEAALRLKAQGENSLYLTYVEESPPARDLPTEIEPSVNSLELLGQAQRAMEEKGITAVPVWRLGENPGILIADAARELGVNTVMIGTTKRTAITRLIRGDVLRTLAHKLPKECHLIIVG